MYYKYDGCKGDKFDVADWKKRFEIPLLRELEKSLAPLILPISPDSCDFNINFPQFFQRSGSVRHCFLSNPQDNKRRNCFHFPSHRASALDFSSRPFRIDNLEHSRLYIISRVPPMCNELYRPYNRRLSQ